MITIWDTESSGPLTKLSGAQRRHDNRRHLSPDGETLAAAAEDGTITLWDNHAGTKFASCRELPLGFAQSFFRPTASESLRGVMTG